MNLNISLLVEGVGSYKFDMEVSDSFDEGLDYFVEGLFLRIKQKKIFTIEVDKKIITIDTSRIISLEAKPV